MKETARRTFVATLVVVAVVAVSLALWKLKLVIALVFLGLIIAASMRPTVDRLANHRVPRPLLGIFGGVVEIVPVIGPLAAGAVAVGVGLTASWHVALFAPIAVLVVRQVEDYVVIPRVMGHVTGLSPMLVLVSVTAVGLLFGGFYVLMATPLAAVLATLVDVIVRDKDPAEEDVPTVLFAKES